MTYRFKSALLATTMIVGLMGGTAQADGLTSDYLSGSVAAMRGDYRAASKFFGAALKRDPKNEFIKQNAMLAALSLGEIPTALGYAKDLAVDPNANNALANMVVFMDHIKAGNFDDAATLLDATKDNYIPLITGLLQGWTELGRGKMGAVIETFDAMTAPPTVELFAQYHKALVLAAVGDFETADKLLKGDERGNLRLTRGSLIAHAQIMAELDRTDDALRLLDAAILGGQDTGLSTLRAAIANGTSQYNYITNAQQGIAEVMFTVASLLSTPDDQQTSLLYARFSQNLRPDDTEATLLISELLRGQEQYELAIENYTKVPPESGHFLNAELGRADTLVEAGKQDAAVEVLRGLARTHGDNPRVHMSLGDVLRGVQRYSGARDAYDKAIAMIDKPARNHWFLFYATAICNERLDNWPRAEMNFRRALELAPNQPLVLNYLGYSLVEKRLNLTEAQAMIETAFSLQPENGAIADSLGWVLYRLNKFEEAVAPMETAVQLEADDPVVNDHLGDVYWMVGRKREAEFQWRRAISFHPAEEDLNRIRRKLELGLNVVLEEEKTLETQTGDQ
jgi:Flp pilus assembly protein TadD